MKKLLFVLLMLLAVFTSASAVLVEEDAYLDGMEAYNRKEFDRALTSLTEFKDTFPESKYMPNVLLKIAELTEDFDKKTGMYNEIIKKYYDSEYEAEAVFSLGRLYYVKNDFEKAEEYLRLVLGKYSNTVWVEQAYYYLLLTLTAAKKYADANTVYSDYAANKNFYIFKSRMDLAYADGLYRQDKQDSAIPLYEAIIKESSGEKYIYMPAVYLKLSDCYRRKGDDEAADKVEFDLREKYPDSEEVKKTGKETLVQSATAAVTEKPTAVPAPVKTPGQQAAADPTGPIYTVQVGAYSNKKFADLMVKKLQENGYSVYTREAGSLLKVQVGKFKVKADADAFAKRLAEKEKIEKYLVKQEKD